MWTVSPEIVEPDFVICDETMTAMYGPMLAGGGVEFPGSVDQPTPHGATEACPRSP